ncbi:hypothetical protein F5B19DRAFT_466767 [Rostrohypoxylon terebratum]|nr:hypothetical protein F5B19DRAFT_466767 [Rostrohypoxylon terebratum]
MVGIRTSNRCEQCRGRKIKCDEKWPTCSPCRRTNKACSGPPVSRLKFVSSGKSSGLRIAPKPPGEENAGEKNAASKPPIEGSSSSISGDRSLVMIRERPTNTGGGNYMVLRARATSPSPPSPPSPSTPLQSREDLLASRLIRCISSGAESGRGLQFRVTWIHLAVPRLGSSLALSEALNLLLSSWTKYNQTPATSPEIDRTAYVRALNALNTALRDPEKSYSVDTLAATALVYIVEFDYDMKTRSANESHHAAGLSALMIGKGPPRADDDLDIRLCFENIGFLLTHILLNDKDNFFSEPEWLEVMRGAVYQNISLGDPLEDPEWIERELVIYKAQWPDLIKDLRSLNATPNPSQAYSLIAKARELTWELFEFDIMRITDFRERGHIRSIADPETGFIQRYEFEECVYCQILQQHALVSIAFNRMLQSALECVGSEDPSVDAIIDEYSERIWKTLPYTEKMPRSVRDDFLAPLLLSLESADRSMRRYLTQKIIEISGPRAQLLGDNPEAECLAMGRALIGRTLDS